MSLCKWHTFWMTPCLIYFFVFLFYTERKWLLMRNLAVILLLKTKLSGKFQRFNAINRSIEMLKNIWISKKFQLKWKIVKYFARPKQPAALRKSFSFSLSHLHQIKPYYVSERKKFLRRYLEIYRHFASKCFKNAVLGRQEMVQCNIFSDTKQKHEYWKICRVRTFFGFVVGAYYS